MLLHPPTCCVPYRELDVVVTHYHALDGKVNTCSSINQSAPQHTTARCLTAHLSSLQVQAGLPSAQSTVKCMGPTDKQSCALQCRIVVSVTSPTVEGSCVSNLSAMNLQRHHGGGLESKKVDARVDEACACLPFTSRAVLNAGCILL